MTDTLDVTQLECWAAPGQPGEDNRTHHMVPKGGKATCTHCGLTPTQIGQAMDALEELQKAHDVLVRLAQEERDIEGRWRDPKHDSNTRYWQGRHEQARAIVIRYGVVLRTTAEIDRSEPATFTEVEHIRPDGSSSTPGVL